MSDQQRQQRQREAESAAMKWANSSSRGFEPTAIKLPDGATYFKLESVGSYDLDVIPYVVKNNPDYADPGHPFFMREYNVHRIPAPDGNKKLYLCAWTHFKKKCACCEWMNKNNKPENQELVKSMRPQLRHLWNVINLGSKDRKIQIFDTNHFNRGFGFGEMVKTAIKANEAYQHFADLKGGCTWHLSVVEQTMPGRKFNAVTRIDFIPRKHDYEDKYLKKAWCLDDCLVEPSYKEVDTLLNPPEEDADDEAQASPLHIHDDDDEKAPAARDEGLGVKDEEDDEKPKAPAKKPSENGTKSNATWKVGDLCNYKSREWKVVSAPDGGMLLLEDEDGNRKEGVDPAKPERVVVADDAEDDDDSELEDSELEEKDEAKEKAGKKPAAVPDDDDDEDDDDSDLAAEDEDDDDDDSELEDSDLEEDVKPAKVSKK